MVTLVNLLRSYQAVFQSDYTSHSMKIPIYPHLVNTYYLSFFFFLRFTYLFIYGSAGSSLLHKLSLVEVSRGYSRTVVCGLLIAVAFVVEHGL